MASTFRIGILSYNHPEITTRTIESCLTATSSAPITLLHNGSDARWVKQLQARFPNLEHIILNENRGFTGGANALIERVLVQSEWCLFLTNDVQLIKAQQPSQVGLVTPLIHRRKQGFIDSMGALFDPNTGRLEHCRSLDAFLRPKKSYLQYIPGTAFWVHRDLFQSIGGYDERLGTYWEDVDYSQRVRLAGQNLLFCEKTELIHSVGKTCHKLKKYTAYLFVRNKYYVSLKYNQRPLAKLKFKVLYWSQWFFQLLKALIKNDQELIKIKFLIVKDILFGDFC